MEIDVAAKIIWDYMQMHEEPKKSDVIFVLCSMDTRVAERAADLYIQGYAPRVVISGGKGKLTEKIFSEPEAVVFSKIMLDKGVPMDRILLEQKSSNTGENILFTYKLLEARNEIPNSLLLVQKPYMERRTYATFICQWPGQDTKMLVTSPRLSYEEYVSGNIDKELVLHVMVGDLQRIREYPKRGLQIEQAIPEDVWMAYEFLVNQGYTGHLLSDA